MRKIAILADSGCQIPLDNDLDRIYIVPLQVIIDQDTYLDGQVSDMSKNNRVIDAKTAFQKMKDDGVMPKTSQPTTGVMVDALNEIKKDGYDEVIAISIATGLSSALNGMKVAADMAQMPITLVDSKATARNHRYLVEVAKELIEEGKTSKEVKTILDKLVETSGTIIYTSNLDHLKRGGRITPAVAMLGGMLKIVPIMKLNHGLGGKIDSFSKVRTVSKANSILINHLEKIGVNEKDYIITVEHVDNADLADKLINDVKEEFGENIETVVGYLPSVVGVHMGIGGIGCQYIKKYKK